MEFITSRGFELPKSPGKMEGKEWFNMWQRRNFPYNEPLVGDILYWFDTKAHEIVWKTEITMIDRFPYKDKAEILKRFPGSDDSDYFRKGAKNGFFVIYKVKELERLSVGKPENFRFPQIGWLRVDDEVAIQWFHRRAGDDSSVLDDNLGNKNRPIFQLLAELNEKMKEVSPERINKMISTTIRKDTPMVIALKKYYDYRCQFPGCGERIRTKKDGYYVEVAHIHPVAKGGRSILGNLLVLCPNHHKGFDHGHLEISEQSPTKLKGNLNGESFEFNFNY